jgi:hypothetical protein
MNRRNLVTRSPQRGAATLVVVMMLFLIMALLAAYANRSVMFDQRISGTLARVAAASQASEAAMDWTAAMLNSGKIDASCSSSSSATAGRFVDRYFNINSTERLFTPRVSDIGIVADCQGTAAGWECHCPQPNSRTELTVTAANLTIPSFGVGFENGGRRGSLLVHTWGCTDSSVDDCISDLSRLTQRQQALSKQTGYFALVSAVRSPPAAPLVARGNLVSAGIGLGLRNSDARSGGSLYIVGGTATGLDPQRLQSVPGTETGSVGFVGDATLNTSTADTVFRTFMGAAPSKYKLHPAIRQVICDGDCAAALATAYDSGQRMVWIDGSLTISSNKLLGTVADPLLIYATGNVTLRGAFELRGMLIAGGDVSWTNTAGGTSLITGHVLALGNVTVTGAADISFSRPVSNQLMNSMGSYVRVPGGWIDGIYSP